MKTQSSINLHLACKDKLLLVRKYATDYHLRKGFDIFGDKFLIAIFGTFLFSVFLLPFLGEKYIFIFFIPIIGIIGALIYRILYYNIFHFLDINGKYRKLLDVLEKTHTNFYDKIDKNSNTEEILGTLKELYRYVQKLKRYRFIWKYSISPTGIFYMMEYIDLEKDFMTEVIKDIISDLHIQLEKQVSLIESKKSELSSQNIGTPELSKISKIQSARLDRQIKQFEELQRVLVKI